MSPLKINKHVFPLALLLLGLIGFGFFLLGQMGFLGVAFASDKSMISWLIVTIYTVFSIHWLGVAWQLDRECGVSQRLYDDEEEAVAESVEEDVIDLTNLIRRSKNSDWPGFDKLMNSYTDGLENRHAAGHFVSDLLLKLGLLGTIIGFILMLTPIGEIKEFDPSLIQQLLGSMSGGMAVALYTTLAGLLTSSLLKIQYYLLDSALVSHINIITVYIAAKEDAEKDIGG